MMRRSHSRWPTRLPGRWPTRLPGLLRPSLSLRMKNLLHQKVVVGGEGGVLPPQSLSQGSPDSWQVDSLLSCANSLGPSQMRSQKPSVRWQQLLAVSRRP